MEDIEVPHFEVPPPDDGEPTVRWWHWAAGLAAVALFVAATMGSGLFAASRVERVASHQSQNRQLLDAVHQAVTAEIPGLKAQIARDDRQIASLNYILTREAIPAIEKLAKQVIALGGNPGEITLKPPAGG